MNRIGFYAFADESSPFIDEQIIALQKNGYNGIEMSCIVNHCYKKLPLMEWYTPKTQLKTLETALYYLLELED